MTVAAAPLPRDAALRWAPLAEALSLLARLCHRAPRLSRLSTQKEGKSKAPAASPALSLFLPLLWQAAQPLHDVPGHAGVHGAGDHHDRRRDRRYVVYCVYSNDDDRERDLAELCTLVHAASLTTASCCAEQTSRKGRGAGAGSARCPVVRPAGGVGGAWTGGHTHPRALSKCCCSAKLVRAVWALCLAAAAAVEGRAGGRR